MSIRHVISSSLDADSGVSSVEVASSGVSSLDVGAVVVEGDSEVVIASVRSEDVIGIGDIEALVLSIRREDAEVGSGG